MGNKLSHIDQDGKANMVDVSAKPDQSRTAIAKGFIKLQAKTIELIKDNEIKKGDVLTVAEIAGIQAAKKTSDLIPLCHPLQIMKVSVKAKLVDKGVEVTSMLKCIGKTGIEMEALTGVQVGLLTIYDMCKAVDKEMIMENIRVVEKIKQD